MLRVATRWSLREWAGGAVDLTEAIAGEMGLWQVQGVRPANHPRTRLRQYAAWARLHAHPQVCAELAELLAELDARVDHIQPMLSTSAHAPLHVHARYTRIEIQAAFNDGGRLRPSRWDSGVKWLPDEKTDVSDLNRRSLSHRKL